MRGGEPLLGTQAQEAPAAAKREGVHFSGNLRLIRVIRGRQRPHEPA